MCYLTAIIPVRLHMKARNKMPDYQPSDESDDEFIPWDCDRNYPLEIS